MLLFSESTLEEVYLEWDDYMKKWSNGKIDNTSVIKRTLTSKTLSRASELAFDKMVTHKQPQSFSSLKLTSATLSSVEDPHSFKFLFKQTCIVPLAIERKIKAPEAIHLFYIQAVHNVTESHYPCDLNTSIQLAGLQIHCFLGDNIPEIHKVGHLG